ncbi:MAG TPA: 5'/3'-nucleotidase SurE [Gammaproteobacteria bacterium]|nr:5'/3'-nucleotidase SurE [Gammaproteobacteria bacterium]
MFFLVSNDDGYQARGLRDLARVLSAHGDVAVVAPDRDRSGASNSLTLDRPLRVQRADNGYYYVNGTPTDCVHLAITGFLERQPDMVIAGINGGPNLGDDVLYSGTVAAAMEGRFLGYPAMAVSLAGENATNYETAVHCVDVLLKRMLTEPLPADTILNVNVPDVPLAQLAGFAATRLGYRHKSEPAIRGTDPRGRPVYWVGPPGPEADAGSGTDFHAVRHRCVSISPLQVDLTRHASLDTVNRWLTGLEGR